MIADLLMALAKANLAAAAAVVAVLAIRKTLRARFGAKAAYKLWLAPLLAAGAVLAPHPQMPASMSEPIVLQAGAFVAQAQTWAPDLPAALLAVWIAGVLATGAVLIRRQAAFMASLGRLEPVAAHGLWRAERNGVGPAVIGVLRPRVVAPADFEARFAPSEQMLILAHERTHLARGDAGVNALASAIRCLCWFNPLVHLAVRALRMDQELACDAMVIGRFPSQRRAYAELLLKTQIVGQTLPLGCLWPPGAEHPLKARIAMLKSPLPSPAVRIAGAAVALLACAGATSLAWAAAPRAHAPVIVKPDWVEKPVGADFVEFYPKAALATHTEGRATMHCGVALSGELTDCRVVSEDPVGQGFGDAALAMAAKFRMKPQTRDGAPTSGGEINIPMRWLLPSNPGGDPPAASPGA